jgi:hypothetical protein
MNTLGAAVRGATATELAPMLKGPVLPQTDIQSVVADHPCPWRTIERRSGIMIKDALGATILFIAFTGEASRARKRRTAALIKDIINLAV